MTLDLSPRHLSPHDLAQLEAEWTAKDKDEGPLPPTYHYTVDGKVIYTYCATALPFAVMGLLTIAFATLPSEAAWAPSSAHPVSLRPVEYIVADSSHLYTAHINLEHLFQCSECHSRSNCPPTSPWRMRATPVF